MYSRGPVASAAPHLYAYFCLPEPAPPAAAPMSSFIVLATSMLGMAGADGDDDWAPAEPDPAATAAGLGMPGNCFFLLLAPATPPAMVCLGIAGLLLPGAACLAVEAAFVLGDGVVVSPVALRAGDEGEPDDAETDADELAHRLDHAGLFAARRARRRLASTGADGSRDLSAVAEVAPDHARRVWRSGRPCGRISGHPSMRHRRARPDRATHRRRGHRCCHVSRDAISAALGPMSGRAVRPSRLKRGGQTSWATGVGRNRTT